ncbi:MAG: VOC family protein [Geminicoccaceae bacterium]
MGGFTAYRFNHTAFVVRDLDRTIGFFRDLLGFELTSRAPRDGRTIDDMTGLAGADIEVAYLSGLGHRIELILYNAPTDRGGGLPRIFQDGSGHVALDVDDAEAAVEAAGAYGLALVGDIVTIDQGPNKGRKVVYLQSEDGLSVEFIQVDG